MTTLPGEVAASQTPHYQTAAESPTVDDNVKAPRHLPYLDGWRGCAIVTLMLGHFAPIALINNGRMGVELFFVLSGRLMAEILFVKEFPLGEFFKRRFARIYPALIVLTIILTLYFKEVTWIDAVKALTFTINYFRGNGIIHHIWSLCVEEHSYVVLALVAFIVRRWKISALGVCLFLAFVCITNGVLQSIFATKYSYYTVYWRSDVRAASIFLASAAFLFFRERKVAAAFPIVASILGIIFQIDRFFPDFIKYSVGSACFAAAIATIGQAPKWTINILSSRVLVLAGTFSYSIYLWQQPFYHTGGRIYLPFVAISALLSFYLVEKPARKFISGLGVKTQKA